MCVVRYADLTHTCPIDTHRGFKIANLQKYVRPVFEGHVQMNPAARPRDLRSFHQVSAVLSLTI